MEYDRLGEYRPVQSWMWLWLTVTDVSTTCVTVNNRPIQEYTYPDDHLWQPLSTSSQHDALRAVEACFAEVRAWMVTNRLRINDTESQCGLPPTVEQGPA